MAMFEACATGLCAAYSRASDESLLIFQLISEGEGGHREEETTVNLFLAKKTKTQWMLSTSLRN